MLDRQSLRSIGIGLILAAWGVASAFAQETNANGASSAPLEKASRPGVRRVYLPFDSFDVLLERDTKGVLLPGDEFRRLYRQANEKNAAEGAVPRGIVLGGASYEARIDGERLVIDATIDVRAFREGWQSVPLALRNLSIEKATLGDEAARLGRLGGGIHLLVDQPGSRTLHLELSTELSGSGSDRVAEFGLLPLVPSTLEVALPAGKRLLVGESLVERPAAADEAATYRLPVGGNGNVALRITDRDGSRAADRLLFATTQYGLNVTPGEVLWHAATTVRIYGRTVDRLVFRVPRALEIADVVSPGLEAWELEDDEEDADATRITAVFRQPIEGTRRVEFTGVMSAPVDETWEAPRLIVAGATSHVGRIAVRQPPGVRLLVEEAEGVRRVGTEHRARDSVAEPPTAVTLAFDVWREDFSLRFASRAKDRELIAVVSTALAIEEQAILLETTATLTTFFTPLFDVEATLPAEWTVTDVLLDGKRVPWKLAAREAGVHHVAVALPKPLSPGRNAKLELRARRELENELQAEQPLEFDLPEVRIPAAGVVAGTYAIRFPEHLDVVPVRLQGLDPAFLDAADPADPQTPEATATDDYLAYRYQDSRFSGVLKVLLEPARIAATTTTVARLDSDALRSHLETILDVEGGGIRKLDVSLPANTGVDLRFQLVSLAEWNAAGRSYIALGTESRIIEQRPAPVEKGRRTWTLSFDRRLDGRFLLIVSVHSTRTEGEPAQVPELRIPAAERHNGNIAIEAEARQRLTITAEDAAGVPLSLVDPIDLVRPHRYVPHEEIVAAYQYVRPGFEVTVAEQRLDRVSVPTAFCRRQTMRTIVAADGALRHEAKMRVVAIGVQAIHIAFPRDREARLWSATLDGIPVEVRRAGETYRLPFNPENARAEHVLALHYASRTDRFDMFDRLAAEPPALAVERGDGSVNALEVAERKWSIHYPPDLLLLDSVGDFDPRGELDRYSLLGNVRQAFTVASPAQLLDEATWLGIAAAFVLIVGLTFHRWGGRGLVGLALLGMIGGALLLIILMVGGMWIGTDANIDFMGGVEITAETGAAAGDSRADAEFDELIDALDESGYSESLDEQDFSFDTIQRQEIDQPQATAPEPGPSGERSAAEPNPNMPRPSEKPDSTSIGSPPTYAPNQSAFAEWDRGSIAEDKPRASASPGARLSLAVEMGIPDGYRSRTFSYIGAAGDHVGLQVDCTDRESIDAFRWLLAIIVFAIFWMLRNISFGARGILAALALTLPLALLSLVPVGWQVVLDGVFLGAVAGTAIWLVRSMARGISSRTVPAVH